MASDVRVLYHAACKDGFCAAWVAWSALEGPEHGQPVPQFIPVYYGTEPPDVTGACVYLLDFCYPRHLMDRLAAQAAELTVLDHHRTAEADLLGFPDAPLPHVLVTFDMERSGAGLTWDHFHPKRPRPWLVDYVEDQDLWRHQLPDSKRVNAYVSSLPFQFGAWALASGMDLSAAEDIGQHIEAKTAQYVVEVNKNARMVPLGGHLVPCVNAPQVDISELLSALAEAHPEAPFALGWWMRGDRVFQYSLRSRDGFDVSEVARSYGGGGHKAAAGFTSKWLLV